MREARERACEAREKKPTVRFPYNEFVPTRGFKNVVELSKICSRLRRPLCEFDTLSVTRENSACYCLHLASNLDAVIQ